MSQRIRVPLSPTLLASGDFDGNGTVDFVAGGSFWGVSVIFVSPEGVLQPRINLPTAGWVYDIDAFDANGDGLTDILVSVDNPSPPRLLLIESLGAGLFRTSHTYPADAGPVALAVWDRDGDGDRDVLLLNGRDGPGNRLVDFRNIGQGRFAGTKLDAPGVGPSTILLHDLDADGQQDYVLGYRFEGPGTLHLSSRAFAPVPLEGSTTHGQIQLANVDDDGKLDLVATTSGGSLEIHRGRPDGTFAPRDQRPYNFVSGASDIELADFDGDGRTDIAWPSYLSRTLEIVRGVGDATFEKWMSLEVGTGFMSAATTDLDGDGRPDLVAANFETNELAVLLNRGNGRFDKTQTLSVPYSPRALLFGDPDRNGAVDLLVGGQNGQITLLSQFANGMFAEQRIVGMGRAIDLQLADVNGDGVQDLLAASFEGGSLDVYFGRCRPTP